MSNFVLKQLERSASQGSLLEIDVVGSFLKSKYWNSGLFGGQALIGGSIPNSNDLLLSFCDNVHNLARTYRFALSFTFDFFSTESELIIFQFFGKAGHSCTKQ